MAADGERIVGDVIPAPPGAPMALFLHGLGSHRQGEKASFLAAELPRNGLGFARFDFRGHGESEGAFERISLSRLLADVTAFTGHLAAGRCGPPPPTLLLIGASLGGWVAAWHSLLSPSSPVRISGQVLIAPAMRLLERYLEKVGPSGRASWEREGRFRFSGPWLDFELSWSAVEDARRYPHSRLLAESRVATLLIHGDADDTSPLAESRRFAAECAAPTRLDVVAGGDHRLTACKERLRDAIVRFAREDCRWP
jgi:pimeloyl-ACP methyl ester carboxylesterase